MNKSRATAATIGLLIGLMTANAFACGESLFRVGKGVGFREYTAPLPGSVLVVANTPAEMAMVERLAAAGHDVHVVSEPSQIGSELENHQIDIVLAYYSQRDEVESQMISMGPTTYIPVAMDGTTEVSEADKQYRASLTNEDSVLKYLKTIHLTLKNQG
jgi:NADPH-dependent glutamate synthase beta subunit-like oxidoreductase